MQISHFFQPLSNRGLQGGSGLALTALVFLQLIGCGQEKAATPPAAPEVQVADVEQRDVPIYSEWVATLDGYVNAQIQPQVTGYLWKQNYREGTMVHRGEILFEIDPRPFEATLQNTKGQLAQSEAQLSKTTLDVQRDTPLARQSAIPQAQLDNDVQAKAAAEALVVAAKAQVDQAQLNVGFTKVRSLVDGIAGIAKSQIGDLVTPTTVLTTVSQVDPIKAYFAISEQEYLKAAQRISEAYVGKRKGPPVQVELILADGSVFPEKGSIVLADREVDVKTGTMRLAGAFRNPGGILRPGQFARVRIQTQIAKDTLLVPQRSVIETQGSYQVVSVGADNKASIRPVKVGERVGEMWIITEGLKPGERVVVEGQQKIKEGTPVTPVAAPTQSARGQ
jgi:membrane fusion protein (multidrug efflux system)